MKKVPLICLLMVNTLILQAQDHIAYQDAVYLKGLYKQSGVKRIKINPELTKYLEYYFPNKETIFAETKENPFLSNYFSEAEGAEGFGPGLGSVFTSIGNADVTTFTDGLAKFLVARTKEELNVAFFRKFQDWLTKHQIAAILFPSTAAIINSVASYNYSAILPALSASFQQDFNAIGENMLKLRDASNYKGYDTSKDVQAEADKIIEFLTHQLPGRLVMVGAVGINSIVKGNNPAEIIADIAADPSCDQAANNDILSNSVQLIQILSQSVRSTDSSRVWISKEQVKAFLSDSVTLKLYFGLLYQIDLHSPHPIVFKTDKGTTTLHEMLKTLAVKWNNAEFMWVQFKQHFKETLDKASEVSNKTIPMLTENTRSAPPTIIEISDYTTSISIFIKLGGSLFNTDTVLNPNSKTILQKLSAFFSVVNDAVGSYYDIKTQNYGALVINTSNILGYILHGQYTFKTDYIKYGSFMASVLTAKNSDEVAAAIDAAVLPAGSSSVKRETDMNISLNAYVGIYGGLEYMPVLKTQQTAYSMGLTAPVGIAFSWGNHCRGTDKSKGGKSITLFVSLIDIGAMAAFRFSNDSANVASTVQFKNIIAPGVYGYWGFGRSPISIGIGAQLGPQLRTVSATEVNVTDNYYIRFGLNVVVDIPFFNFYTRQNNSD